MCRTRFMPALAVLLLGALAGQAPAAEDPTLVGWWTFDDGSGTIAKDSSGYGNNGTFSGNPQWTSGYFAGALEFNGSDAYLNCGSNPSLDLTTWTIAFWLKVAENKNYNGFVIKGLDAAENYEVLGFADGSIHMPIMFADGTRTYVNTATGLIVVGQWAHFAYTYSSGKGRHVYKDGNQVFSDAQAGTPRASTSALTLGNEQPMTRFTHGTMDDVRIYNRVLTDAEIKAIMTSPAKLAGSPDPADKAVDVPRDASLSWSAGRLAAAHDVYLAKTFADVNDASIAKPAGVLLSQGQTATTYQPAALLDFGQTYYWRVDEVNKAPDSTIFKGSVWSFTAEPYGYPITKVTATASSGQAGMGPEKTIDGSGLTGDLHGIDGMTMWLSTGAQPNWIQYEFDKAYKLWDLKIWNSNQLIESFLGFGAKEFKIEYSTDGATWTPLQGVPQFARASGLAGYAAGTTVSFGGVMAKYVKLTINSSWGGMAVTGLSEVRFSYVPVQARSPQPATAATGVAIGSTLNWRPGREAGSHKVFFGTDPNAVANGTAAAKTVTDHAFDPGALLFGTTYYWKVDEVNTVTYPGDLWSFTTQEFAAVDDFESYNDKDHCIFDTWIDGMADSKSGSQVGYLAAPFAEQTIVHGGKQSMPLAYDNTKSPFYSETTRDLGTAQDWTGNGATHLDLWFRGYPALNIAVTETAGKMTLTGDGTDIWNNSDDFVFACKTLTGDGSIIARVVSVGTGTNTWAKGGVMIRGDLTAGSTFVNTVITGGGGNGASFQYRLTTNGGGGNADAAAVLTAPYWVKLERKGNTITGSLSANGTTWAQQGTPQTITMTGPACIGLCVTSHQAGEQRTMQFDSIATTGGVTGVWQGAQINSSPHNTPAGLYVVVEDNAGKSKLIAHPDPAATTTGTWTQWTIPLGDLTAAGVKTTKVQKVTVGIGDRSSPKAGGNGMLFIDDIGYGHPSK